LVETFRPLLPVGYDAGVDAYRAAVESLSAADLSRHYTQGLTWFHETFVPALKDRLAQLSGGALELDDFVAVAAGSDCDFISHLVEAVSARAPVRIYPGDWFGFRVGCSEPERVAFASDGRGAALACVCVPSVRNGRLTEEMLAFLSAADACLLNLNLYPTLPASERAAVARALAPLLERAVLSISFSRGFGLTASQLGVALVRRDHPLLARLRGAWEWHTYFFNALAARAFLALDLDRTAAVDRQRRRWVGDWLRRCGLPDIDEGSYYVRSFTPDGELAPHLRPLQRGASGEIVRLCFKPPQV